MQAEEQDIEKLLSEGNSIRLKPRGFSMYPVLVPGRDEVIVEPISEAKRLKRGDVVLYRRLRENGEKDILVLHRIWKIDEAGFYMVGDNQKEIEGPLKAEQLKGIMAVLIRKGRQISGRNPIYRLVTGIWLWMRPVRPAVAKVFSKIKSFWVGKNKV